MSNEGQYLIGHKDLIEMLLKKHGIHDGIWGVFIEFKFMAANIGPPGEVLPASITAVSRIGLQPFPEESSLAFDAAKLNPPKAVRGDTRKRVGRDAVIRK